MEKGIKALELIFTLVILVVVVVVVINMFWHYFRTPFKEVQKPLDEMKQAGHFESERAKCMSLCNRYAETCSLQDAVSFCEEKVALDLDGNGRYGERGHGGVVNKIPYCEDGLYCFHIVTDCGCGSLSLDAASCLRILCEYYMSPPISFDKIQAIETIRRSITPGTCNPDPTTWLWADPSSYCPLPETVPELGVQGKNPLGGPYCEYTPGDLIVGADRWWKLAGYASPDCESIQVGGGVPSCQYFCVDPDAGTDELTQRTQVTISASGTMCITPPPPPPGENQDRCEANGQITEYYCISTESFTDFNQAQAQIASKTVDCPAGTTCVDGACV